MLLSDKLMTIDAEWFGYNLQYPLIDLIRAAEKDHRYVNWVSKELIGTCSCGKLRCPIYEALEGIEKELVDEV